MLCEDSQGEETMSAAPISSIEGHFGSLADPRRDDSRTPHQLLDIIITPFLYNASALMA